MSETRSNRDAINDGAIELIPSTGKGDTDLIGGISTDGKTVFLSSNRNMDKEGGIGGSDIFYYSIDTGKIMQISTDAGDHKFLAYCPGTEMIMYSRDLRAGHGYPDCFTMNRYGRNVTLLFSESSPLRPWPITAVAFSPDGDKLAFPGGERNLNRYIQILDLNTEEIKRLGDKPQYPTSLAWSPDGKYIAYSTSDVRTGNSAEMLPSYRDTKPNSYIYILSLENGSLRKLDVIGKHPDWSPNGNWIAFIRQIEAETEIYITPVKGGKVIRVTRGGGFDPHWAPDGKRIIFNSSRKVKGVGIYYIDVSAYVTNVSGIQTDQPGRFRANSLSLK
jgi:Tol biopolymer transport system component